MSKCSRAAWLSRRNWWHSLRRRLLAAAIASKMMKQRKRDRAEGMWEERERNGEEPAGRLEGLPHWNGGGDGGGDRGD